MPHRPARLSKISSKVSGSGSVGSDTKPVKVVNGTATPVTKDLMVYDPIVTTISGNVYYIKSGHLVQVVINGLNIAATGSDQNLITQALPRPSTTIRGSLIQGSGNAGAMLSIYNDGSSRINCYNIGTHYGSITYVSLD